uniref:Zinc finger PHD-type domain-containing protein n=1 Tax=Anopheles minimus TaxID=112268 RepID=A0A182W4X3_9DIPT
MPCSPVEVRYDDGDAVVLIQSNGGGPARRNSDGEGDGGTTEIVPHASHSGQCSVPGTPESSRIIIREKHGIEGCGSITIVTPTNNLKISINTKRYDRQNGFQASKRTLTNDLRNKLGELDELLKASCDEEDGIVPHEPPDTKRISKVTVQTQPNASTADETEAMNGTNKMTTTQVQATCSAMEQVENKTGACGSDTLQEPLNLLDDVLVRITNDNELFYLGTVIDLEPNGHCLVRFEDTTRRWFEHSSVTRCNSNQRVLRSMVQSQSQSQDNNKPLVQVTSPSRLLRFPPEFFPMVSATQLPYDLAKLQWDANHRVNTTGNYCYCGNDGDWAREMIQCRRCEQWFHGRCVRSLQFPIFHGDTFYVFICSICNHGHEFVRRLVLSAENIAHLVLYNLIMRNGRRFYGLRSAIIPYIHDNQRALQLPEKFVKLSTNERAVLLQNVLSANRNRFYNGREHLLSSLWWALRYTVPPPIEPITIPIPPEDTVTESKLQQKLENTDHFRFLPRAYHERSYFMDGATRERMLGLAYANEPESTEVPRALFKALWCDLTGSKFQQQQSTTTVCATTSSAASHQQPTPPDISSGLVGARRRKCRGIRHTPVGAPIPGGLLDDIIPLPTDFYGANNPFYEDDSESISSGGFVAARCRRLGQKARAPPVDQRSMPSAKRRKTEHSGSSSVRGALPRTRKVFKRKLSVVKEEESPSALSWDNVQRHNNEHSGNGGDPAYARRSTATCSSSSCVAEQVDASAVASGAATVNSDGSCAADIPMASGRRSSGRLSVLPNKDYSCTRSYKRRREAETQVQVPGAAGSSRRRRNGTGCDDTETDQSNGDRLSTSEVTSSGDSSHVMRDANCDRNVITVIPVSARTAACAANQEFVIVGKRTLPNGEVEYLCEEVLAK